MFLTLVLETDNGPTPITFDGTPNDVNLQLRGFFGEPCVISKVIVMGESDEK